MTVMEKAPSACGRRGFLRAMVFYGVRGKAAVSTAARRRGII